MNRKSITRTSVSIGLCLIVVLLVAASPASAVCLATGKSCGLNAPSNDRLCCPGMVCGWGNVCQAGCRINGQFYRSGALNPANACQSCQPASSTTTWKPRTNGTACNDGHACTYADKCTAGSCGGTAITCTSDTCNLRTCNGTAACTVTPTPGQLCDDGGPCTFDDTCQSNGSCLGSPLAAPVLIDPANLATGVSRNPDYSWNAAAHATSYSIDVAKDAGFTIIVDSATGVAGASYHSGVTLDHDTSYYWRVKAVSGACESGHSGALFTTCASGSCPQSLVGSYLVSDGPVWDTNPPTYTCQEACALVFGGASSEYSCSTVSNSIDHMANTSAFAVFGCLVAAEDYKKNTQYSCGAYNCSQSAYVDDNCDNGRNYCFHE